MAVLFGDTERKVASAVAPHILRYEQEQKRRFSVNNLIYLVGLVVIVLFAINLIS